MCEWLMCEFANILGGGLKLTKKLKEINKVLGKIVLRRRRKIPQVTGLNFFDLRNQFANLKILNLYNTVYREQRKD